MAQVVLCFLPMTTFCVLDDKPECEVYYKTGNLISQGLSLEKTSKTWKYSQHLSDTKVDLAYVYCEGRSIDEVCPVELKPRWTSLNNKMKSYVKSLINSKINIRDVCLSEVLPEQFLLEYFEVKCNIIDSVFENYDKPVNYDFKLKLEYLLNKIYYTKTVLRKENLKKRNSELKVRRFLKKINKVESRIGYSQFGTKTRRLATQHNTIPLLTMEKDFRCIFSPNNHYFVELDYNSADIRSLIGLSGLAQPEIDIHEWNRKQINSNSRKETKQKFFAWLYGSSKVDGSEFERIYNVQEIKNKYWNGVEITNPFGEKIEADEFHSLNYLVQSTTSDISLRAAVKVDEYLKSKKSNISMLIHDSIIIDLHEDDLYEIIKLNDIFSETIFGKYKTSVNIGKNLSEMKRVNL